MPQGLCLVHASGPKLDRDADSLQITVCSFFRLFGCRAALDPSLPLKTSPPATQFNLKNAINVKLESAAKGTALVDVCLDDPADQSFSSLLQAAIGR